MTTSIPSASAWAGFTQAVSGDGAISISGEVASISSGIATGSAKITKRIFTQPGEIYSMKFMARRVSGSDDTSGSGFIDWPAATSLKTRIEVNSSEWQEYTVRYAVPVTSSATSYIDLGIGVYTSLGGQIQACYPRISVGNTPFGALRATAHGLVYWDGATATLNPSFTNSGVISMRYDAPTKTLFIQTPQINLGVDVRPLAFATMTNDGVAAVLKLFPKVGSYDISNGEWQVKFIDATTGLVTDITGLALYFFFKSEI
jgi:hypothetical protein